MKIRFNWAQVVKEVIKLIVTAIGAITITSCMKGV